MGRYWVPFCPLMGSSHSTSIAPSASWLSHVRSEFWETLSIPPVLCSPALPAWQKTDHIRHELSRQGQVPGAVRTRYGQHLKGTMILIRNFTFAWESSQSSTTGKSLGGKRRSKTWPHRPRAPAPACSISWEQKHPGIFGCILLILGIRPVASYL